MVEYDEAALEMEQGWWFRLKMGIRGCLSSPELGATAALCKAAKTAAWVSAGEGSAQVAEAGCQFRFRWRKPLVKSSVASMAASGSGLQGERGVARMLGYISATGRAEKVAAVASEARKPQLLVS